MPRCNACSKFVSLDEAEPEVQSLDVDSDGAISAEVRIVNTCAECGEELTEYTFEVTAQATLPDESDCEHDLEIEDTGAERTQPDHTPARKNGKPTPMRYRRTWYGFLLEATVRCTQCDYKESLTLEDDVQASAMEALG